MKRGKTVKCKEENQRERRKYEGEGSERGPRHERSFSALKTNNLNLMHVAMKLSLIHRPA